MCLRSRSRPFLFGVLRERERFLVGGFFQVFSHVKNEHFEPKNGSLEDDFPKKTGDVQVPAISFEVNTLQRGEKRNLGLCYPNAPWDEHITYMNGINSW